MQMVAHTTALVPQGQTHLTHEAFRRVYDGHSRAVYAVACRACGPDLATDVTQDVFLRLWRHPERYDPARGSMRTFLLTVTNGVAIDAVRSEAARRHREARVAAGAETETDAADVGALRADQGAVIGHALSDLTSVERAAIVTAYFGECTYQQAAAALGVPEGTVKSRIRQGLQRLQHALADEATPVRDESPGDRQWTGVLRG